MSEGKGRIFDDVHAGLFGEVPKLGQHCFPVLFGSPENLMQDNADTVLRCKYERDGTGSLKDDRKCLWRIVSRAFHETRFRAKIDAYDISGSTDDLTLRVRFRQPERLIVPKDAEAAVGFQMRFNIS